MWLTFVVSIVERMSNQTDQLTDPTTESQISIGFPDEANPNPPHSAPIKAQPNSEKNLPVNDQCCLVFYHIPEEKILLTRLKHKGFFLPAVEFTSHDSLLEVVTQLGRILLKETQGADAEISQFQPHLLQLQRTQLPKHYPKFVTRVIFGLAIGPKSPAADLIVTGDKFKISSAAKIGQEGIEYLWFTENEIKTSDKLWGPEPHEYFVLMRTKCSNAKRKFTPVLREVDQQDMTRFMANSTSSKEKELLLSAQFNMEEVEKLSNEFIIQCFPSQFMAYPSFRFFMDKLGWMNEAEIVITILFRSLTLDPPVKRPIMYLTFTELIVGLAAMEEKADHRGNCLYLRLQYIFHFYDNDVDNSLNVTELNQMVSDIVDKRRSSTNIQQPAAQEEESDKLVAEMLRRLANSSVSEKALITRKQFVEAAIPSDKNRNWLSNITDKLFRSNISTLEVSSSRFDYKLTNEYSRPLKVHGASIRYENACNQCRVIRFAMCSHGIKINDHGMIRATFKFDKNVKYPDIPFVQELNLEENLFSLVITLQHRLSVIAIDKLSGKIIPPPEQSFDLLSDFYEVLRLSKELVKAEPVLIRHKSPCVAIGEVGSNLVGLHLMMSKLQRMAPFVNPVNIVFLGSYIKPEVDFAVETIIYLLCSKLLLPKRITLLRGKSDLRSELEKTNFKKQCTERYDQKMFDAIVEVLELLPCAVLLDDCIFMSNSGIPLSGRLDKMLENSAMFIKNILFSIPQKKLIKSKQMVKKKVLKIVTSSSTITKKMSSTVTVAKSSVMTTKSSAIATKKSKGVDSKTKKGKRKSSDEVSSSKRKRSAEAIRKEVKEPKETSSLSSETEFSLHQFANFLKRNHVTHFIRSDSALPNQKTYRIEARGKMITLSGIGSVQNSTTSNSKDNIIISSNGGTILIVNRFKLRLLHLESII